MRNSSSPMDQIERQEEREERVEELPQEERDALAWLLMRSLRNNWSNPQGRVHLLKTCAEEGLEHFDSEKVISYVDQFIHEYFYSWHDGRVFRSTYQGQPLPEITDEDTALDLIGEIPISDDLLELAVEKQYEEDDG